MVFGQVVKRPRWPWLILMISFPLMYVISLTYSANLAYGIFSIEKRISLFLVPIVVSTVPVWVKEKRDRFFFYAYLSALLAALVCILIATYTFFMLGINTFYWTALTQPLGFHPGY